MEWMCGSCYLLIHPTRKQRGLTSRVKHSCASCNEEAICELAQGETVEEARQLLEESRDGD